jgi:hypothetical protein
LDHTNLIATEYFSFILSLYQINASQNYRPMGGAPVQWVENLSHLFQLRRTAPQSITAEDFWKFFKWVISVFENSLVDEFDQRARSRYAQIVLQVIEEFHTESYFDEARLTMLMFNKAGVKKSSFLSKADVA